MVITAQPIGANHAAYYIGTAQRQAGAVGYYAGRSGELSGKWISAGDMNVIAGSPIDSGELTAMLAGCDPQTGERLGTKYAAGGTFVDRLGVTRKRHSRGAFDVTYSVPKSVSAAWALADPEVRKQIEAAFDLSADAAVAYLQRHAVASRSGKNGINRAHVPNGATVARYDHWCSRAGDPQMHAHMLFANRVLCEDGKWRTLDSRRRRRIPSEARRSIPVREERHQQSTRPKRGHGGPVRPLVLAGGRPADARPYAIRQPGFMRGRKMAHPRQPTTSQIFSPRQRPRRGCSTRRNQPPSRLGMGRRRREPTRGNSRDFPATNRLVV